MFYYSQLVGYYATVVIQVNPILSFVHSRKSLDKRKNAIKNIKTSDSSKGSEVK